MKLINIEALVRLKVGKEAVTDFEKVEYVYKPTQGQQRTKFAALKDVAVLVFKENMKGKFKLRIENNEGATYPSDWNTRRLGLRDKVENAFHGGNYYGTTFDSWHLEYRDLIAVEVEA